MTVRDAAQADVARLEESLGPDGLEESLGPDGLEVVVDDAGPAARRLLLEAVTRPGTRRGAAP